MAPYDAQVDFLEKRPVDANRFLSHRLRSVTEMRQTLGVDGESLDDLLAMLPYFEFGETKAGLVNFRAEAVPNEVAVPFFRALMRREARMLKEDAGVLTDSVVEWRTQTQRRADALVDLVESIGTAARYRGQRPNKAPTRGLDP